MPWGGYVDRVESLRIGDGSVDPGAGNLDVAGTGRIRGNTTLDGTLSVTGTSTLTGAVTASASVTVGTTLGVTGLATLSTVLVTRAAYFSHPVVFSGGAGQPIFSGSLRIAGNPTATAGQVAPTNDLDSRAPSTGRAYLLLPGTKVVSSPAWWKVFSGTTAYYLPAFTDLYSG